MNPLQDAFISYGRADSKQFAQTLSERLKALGYTVWFDFNDIPLGVDYQKQIDDGIEKADNFLYLISPHSVNSAYCGLEVELALKCHKRIIPLLHVEEISYDTWQQRNPHGSAEDWEAYKAAGKHSHFTNMHPEIRKINWVYFREGIDDFEQSFQGLVALLEREKDYVHRHTVLLNNALEWECNQKQTRYLLTGEERQQAETWLAVRFTESQPPVVPTDLHYEYITESIKNGDNLMTQVFLSHAEEDAEITDQVRRTLMRAGITTWTYRSDIEFGSDFEAALKRGVEEADNVLYLMSPYALKSKYCQQEIDLAVQLNKRLIIMLVEAVDETDVPVKFRNLQYINLTDNKTEADYLRDEDALLRLLKQDASYFNEHKVLLTKALKWERQQRNPCILLQGYELQHAQAWQEVAQARDHHGPTDIQTEFIEASKNQTAAVSPDVFISYSRADSDFARKLNNALQRQRKRTWFDQESIASGADFKQEIYKGIESSNFFLFVLSPRSVKSPYCADEVEYAAKLNKRMVTVLHRPVEATDLHPELAKVQWTDFNANEGEFEANFKELLRTLDTDPVHLRYHTGLLMKAIDWDEKERRDDVLLRGSELTEAQQWMVQAAEKEPRPTVLQGEYVAAGQGALEAEQKKSAKRQRLFLIAVSTALGIAIGLGVAAFRENQKAKRALRSQVNVLSEQSLVLSQANLRIEALMSALRSVQLWRGSLAAKPDLSEQLSTALLPIIHGSGFTERNRLTGHYDDIYAVTFSPDGQTLASASVDGKVKLWTPQGQELQTLVGHKDAVNNVAFSPDGQTLASASDDETIRLWTLDGNLLQTLKHNARIRGVTFSPDGQTIASSSTDKTIQLWNLQGEKLKTLKGHKKGWVNNVAFSPDGQSLASASDDKTVKLWSLQGDVLQTLEGHEDEVLQLAFSPDGETLASAGKDKTIKLWNLQGEELRTIEGHKEPIYSVTFSPDGQTLASTGIDKTVRLWSLKGELLQTLEGHQGWGRDVAFSPDGQTLSSTGIDGTVKLWAKAPDYTTPALIGHKHSTRGAAFSPDSQILASANDDDTIKLWDRQGNELKTLKGHEDWVRGVVFGIDGKTLISGSDDQTIKIWNLQGEVLRSLEGHDDWIYSVVLSPDGQTIASGSKDGIIKLWSLQGELLHTLEGHQRIVQRVTFSPDGQTIASASEDGTVKLWSLDGELLQTLVEHPDQIYSVAFSPDGQTIASANHDRTVKLWSLTGELLHTLEGHERPVYDVAFSPDGQTLASVSDDRTVKRWTKDGKLLQTLPGKLLVTFSPDGQLLASAEAADVGRAVNLWKLDDLTLDSLFQKTCDWLGDYLTYTAPPEDRNLCN
ncbi:MAG: TIR domain-containing protein [Cyanobacteria bacterium J06656_5]